MILGLLLVSACSLWWHSAMHGAFLIALLGCAYLRMRKEPLVIRKAWLYAGVMPFALWWFLSPAGESLHGVPLSLFFIAGWFFWWLALAQALSLGRGGFYVYLWANSGIALMLSGMEGGRVFLACSTLFGALLLMLFRRDRVPRRAVWLPLVLSALVAAGLAWAGREVRLMVAADSGDFMQGRQLRGFSPVSFLGSFAEEYESPYEGQVVLRVYGGKRPDYLRGAVYSEYRMGHWKAQDALKWTYPTGQLVEFRVFGQTQDSGAVWVAPTVNTFGFLLVPEGTGAVAIQGDSLGISPGRALRAPDHAERRGWYAWPGTVQNDTGFLREWLEVPARLYPLVEAASKEAGLEMAQGPAQRAVMAMRLISWFSHGFTYAARPPAPGTHEPLEMFWRSRQGYCEYFATLSTLMLRAQGVPARYVTGFAGPKDDGDGVWRFRRRDAHAWVEYWSGEQWVILDPTPPGAMPPEKPEAFWQSLWEKARTKLGWMLHGLRDGEWKLWLDAWQSKLERWFASPWPYGLLMAALVGAIGYRRWRQRRLRGRPSDWYSRQWARKLEKAERSLVRRGLVRERGETVAQFLQRLGRWEKSAPAEVLRQYQVHRFRASSEAPEGAAIPDRDL